MIGADFDPAGPVLGAAPYAEDYVSQLLTAQGKQFSDFSTSILGSRSWCFPRNGEISRWTKHLAFTCPSTAFCSFYTRHDS